MAQEQSDRLTGVGAALTFLDELIKSGDSARAGKSELEDLKNFEEVQRLARERGYEIDHTSFAEAMKIHVDQSLESSGVPSWIRHRVHAPVHD